MRYQYDIRGMQALKNRYDPKIVEKAFSHALDRTQAKAATHISRDVRDDYHITAADIKKRLKIDRARRDASRSLLYTGRRLPLDHFKPKATRARVVTATSRRGTRYKTRRRGASVLVRKDTGRQQVPGGWFAKGRILRRADRNDNASDPRIQFGPSIPGMVSHESVIDSAQEMVREDLPRQFSGRMDYLLGQKK
jgi:hypothetical protein